MTPRTVKLSAEDEAKETELFAYYGVQGETYSEQYRDFLIKSHKAMRLAVVVDAPENPAVHPIPNFTNFRCPLRRTITVTHKDNKTGATLWTEKKLVCVNNPPQKTFIDGMEICEVCLEKFYGLAKKIKAASPDSIPTTKPKEKEETPAPAPIDVPEVTRALFLANYDNRQHCPFTHQRILSQTCYNCSTQNPKRWNECRALVSSIITPQK